LSGGKHTLGIDLGGTKILAALVEESGRILDRSEKPTPAREGPDAVIEQMVAAAGELRDRAPAGLLGVGVGAAGQIEAKSGSVRFSPNLGWHDVPLQEKLKSHLASPVVVSSDVRAATLGEWVHGAGRGCGDLLCMLVGTGIGGGIITGGHLVLGANNSAGEVGHAPIVCHGPLCTCGNQGCLEALAGGWAIAERARRVAEQRPEAGRALLSLAGGEPANIDARVVAQAHRQGDPLAGSLVDEVAEALIAGLTMLVNVLGPARIILGGGVIAGLPELVERCEAGIRRRALLVATEALEVVPAALGEEAVAIGAATLARRTFGGEA
jgi:glucokinase